MPTLREQLEAQGLKLIQIYTPQPEGLKAMNAIFKDLSKGTISKDIAKVLIDHQVDKVLNS